MSLRDKLPPQRPDDPETTFVVMMWQLGMVCRQWTRHKLYADEKIRRAYRAEARQSLAGLITQCRLLAEECEWDWDGLIRDGEEEFVERMGEIPNWGKGTYDS